MDEIIELLSSNENIPVPQTGTSQYIVEPLKRFGESFLGAPGALENLLTSGIQYVTGMQPAQIPSILDIGKSIVTGKDLGYSRNFFPTPEDIRSQVTEPLFGKSQTSGKNLFSDWVESIASTAGSLAAGIPGLGGTGIVKGLKLASIGSTAKELSKLIGLKESTQELIESATMLGVDMLGTRQNFIKTMEDYYNKAEQLSSGKITHASDLNKFLIKERRELSKLIPEDRREISGLLDTISESIVGKGGASRINVSDVWNLKRRINEKLRLLYNDPKTSQKVLRKIEDINNILKETLQDFGSRNPLFKESFNIAESMFAGLNKRSVINKALQKYVRLDALRNPLIGILVGGGMLHDIPRGILGTTLAYGSREGIQLAEFLYNSPQARKLYARTLQAALQDNGPAIIKYINKLDEKASEYLDRQNENDEIIELL